MRKSIRFFLPLALIIFSIIAVFALVTINKDKRPERKEEAKPAILVDVIEAEVRSLNFVVNSQGSVRPRTETTT